MDDPLKWMKVPNPIMERLKEAAALVESNQGAVRVLSHYDGDGICSAGIVTRALHRASRRFHTTMAHVLTKEDVQMDPGGYDLLIVTDMGSNIARELSDKIIELGIRGIILDHHKPEGRDAPFSLSDGGGVVEINPRFHGVNGTTGASASTIAFLLSIAIDPNNTDLAVFSLAGSIADRQHVPEFSELNLSIKNLAVEKGLIRTHRSMPFLGRDVLQALATSNDPYIKGISGNEKATLELLGTLRIEPSMRFEDLPEDKLKVLQSYVYIRLLQEGVDRSIVHDLFRESMVSEAWGNLQQLAYAIDSSGRLDRTGLGLQVVWGDKTAYEEALSLRQDFKLKVLRYLQDIAANGANSMENLYWMEIEDENLAGTVAGLAHNYVINNGRPMLALSRDGKGKVKVSSRGDRGLTKEGLDLGAVMGDAGKAFGGVGGGHDVAAGGSFLEGQRDGFLERCDELIGAQLKRRKKRDVQEKLTA